MMMNAPHHRRNIVVPEASPGFVLTPSVDQVVNRAHLYLETGYPVHLSGPAGTGKSTLAFHLATKLGRPVTLVHGDHEFGTSDLVGRDNGINRSRLVDNYIRGVVKTEEQVRSVWQDGRLTRAVREGHTLIYDEFTRSRAEANNALLSVLEEGILDLGRAGEGRGELLDVHPDFRIIFTSNPAEYAGTHRSQDALLDRMITIQIDHPNADTEVAIVAARSGLDRAHAARVVAVVRALRSSDPQGSRPSMRSSLAIARILRKARTAPRANDPLFAAICRDVLFAHVLQFTDGNKAKAELLLASALRHLAPVEGNS